MTLNKRYKRDIKNNRSLYISSLFLTVLSLLLFYLYYICGTGIGAFGEAFFESQRVEDAHFSTYMEIPDDEVEKLEEKYNLELEKQRYLNVETDGVTARVFEKTDKVDLYKVTEGRDVSNDGDLILSEGYAVNENIVIGDQVKIRDREYTVCGFVERPDYLYMLQNLSDTDKNISSFFICYMTENDFKELGEKNIQYLVRYRENNSEDFRKAVNEDYIMSSYVAAEDNVRISMMVDQPKLFILMSYCVLITVPLLVVFLISVILSRKIRSEQKMIGTLASFGYTKGQMIRHYAGFSAIPGVIGGVLTTIVVALVADSYGALGLMDYEPLDVDFSLRVPQMLLGILIPTCMYILSTAWTVRRLLKNDITKLLAGSVQGKNRVRHVLVGRKVSFRTKFSVRTLLGNPGRTLVLFLGVFLGSYIILFALGDYDSMNNLTNVTTENMKHYNYQYVLNTLETEKLEKGETLLAAAAEDAVGENLMIYGADGNHLVGLKDMDGQEVEAGDDYWVTSLYAYVSGVKVGDSITLTNPLSMERFEVEVGGILKNDLAKAIYTSRQNVSELTGILPDHYNMILSKEKLDIPEEKMTSMINKDSIEEQNKVVFAQMNTMIYLLIAIGVVICIMAVYIAVNMAVTESRASISMLRVLGYNDRMIRKLMLNDNIFVVIPAMILGLPCAIWTGDALFTSFIDILGYRIDMYIKPLSIVIGLVLVLISYGVSSLLVSRKISRVDMVESLKDNRE